MDDFFTTHQVQDLLQVDRITVYRMLQDGRLQGIKIGQQWRFTRGEVERILQGKARPNPPSNGDSIFPIHCIQTIQDLFSDVSQISALVLDGAGEPVTQTSHPNPLCEALQASPSGLAAYRQAWQAFVHQAHGGSQYFTCPAGLQYIGAPILEQDELIGVFLIGPFYVQAPDPREESDRLRRLAHTHDLPVEVLQAAASSVPVIPVEQRPHLEAGPFSAARAVQSILRERTGFVERLQKIANLTQIS